MSQTLRPAVPEKPLRADARRNRAAVIAAARRVFSEQGRDAQMDDVARRAGVGVGTVYRHFPTKEALIVALAEDSFGQIAVFAREALEHEDAWEGLVRVMWAGGELLAADRALSEVVMQTPEAVEAGAEAELIGLIGRLIVRAQEQGTLRADVMPDDIGMLMCGIGSATKKAHRCADSWRRHLSIVIDGLRASAATGELPRG